MEEERLRRRALELLQAGDAREAFGLLRPLLAYQGRDMVFDEAHWRDDLELLSRVAEVLEIGELASALRVAAIRRDDPDALYDAGYSLIEYHLHDIGATVLTRANRITPGNLSIIAELAAALENQSRYEECRELLAGWPLLLEQAFVLRYLLAFNTLLTGDVSGARRLHETLHPADEVSERFMTDQLGGMLARAEVARRVTSLDERDLRGWHFVLNGSFLLHVSPYGLEDGMNGRYALVQDSDDVCREGIENVAEVLRVCGRKVPRVFSLPGRSDAILAQAAARWLGVPLEPWRHGRDEPGLIVCYDLAPLDDTMAESLGEHREGQVLWVHAMSWIEPPLLAPDLVTYLYQYNSSPWGRRIVIDEQSGRAQEEMPRAGTVEALATEVLADLPAPARQQHLPGLTALVRASLQLPVEHGPGLMRDSGRRRRQWKDSPVPSSRLP